MYFTGNELLPHAALARFLEGHGAFPGVAAELAGILLGLEDYRQLTAGAEGKRKKEEGGTHKKISHISPPK